MVRNWARLPLDIPFMSIIERAMLCEGRRDGQVEIGPSHRLPTSERGVISTSALCFLYLCGAMVDLSKVEQGEITLDAISEIIDSTPRRMKLSVDWPDALKSPSVPGGDRLLSLPFAETLWNAFDSRTSATPCALLVKGRR